MTNFKWPEGLVLKNKFGIIFIITIIITAILVLIII